MKHIDSKKLAAAVLLLPFLGILYIALAPADDKLSDLSGVILAPPPGFHIVAVESGGTELAFSQAVAELEAIRRRMPDERRIALKYQNDGADNFLLFDFEKNVIQQTATNSYGTAVQTIWKGGISARIAWCKQHGNFVADGHAEPVSRNLYH